MHSPHDGGQQGEGRLHEGMARVGERMREGYESVGDAVSSGYRRAEGLVTDYPAPSVLIGFGLGFGLGILLTMAITQREEPTWRDWKVMDTLRDLQHRVAPRS